MIEMLPTTLVQFYFMEKKGWIQVKKYEIKMEWPYLIAWVCPHLSLQIHEVINNIHNESDSLFIPGCIEYRKVDSTARWR